MVKPTKRRGGRVAPQGVPPLGQEEGEGPVADEAADRVARAVHLHERLRLDRAQERGAGHEGVEGDGAAFGRQTEGAADQAVVEDDLPTVAAAEDAGTHLRRANQPVVRDLALFQRRQGRRRLAARGIGGSRPAYC
jgi:hypothetical protein